METDGRFKDAPWYKYAKSFIVTIGGAGGIGSWTSFFLSRAGIPTILYDYDSIEAHNIGGQLYRKKDIGKKKIAAMVDIISNFSNTVPSSSPIKITNEFSTSSFSIAAFDNMVARRALFESWKKAVKSSTSLNSGNAIFIDGRLNMEQLQIYCVMPQDAEKYESTLFDDSSIPDEPCTAQQTSHMAAMIGSMITTFLTNHITNLCCEGSNRVVPFFTEYFGPLNMLKEE